MKLRGRLDVPPIPVVQTAHLDVEQVRQRQHFGRRPRPLTVEFAGQCRRRDADALCNAPQRDVVLLCQDADGVADPCVEGCCVR